MTIDILFCTMNSRIVRLPDLLMEPNTQVRYVISYQYTKDEYLDLIPKTLLEREDVTLVKIKGQGLSENRNNALKYATSDLVYIADDDVRFLPTMMQTITSVFETYSEGIDIALFQAQTYAGRDLREYRMSEGPCNTFKDLLHVLTIEMVCRREKIKNMQFDSRFGLGSEHLSCYEQQVWLTDALRQNLKVCYIAQPIVQTSAIFVPRMIYVDPKVQRSFGALLYYVYGWRAYGKAFLEALDTTRRRFAHLLPVLSRLFEGINYIRTNPKDRIK